jgi:hypothetical protein
MTPYPLIRLIARRDIHGPEWTFAKGRHLVGKRDGPGRWAVWPRRDPLAFLVGVPDELVREIKDKRAKPKKSSSVRSSLKCEEHDEPQIDGWPLYSCLPPKEPT